MAAGSKTSKKSQLEEHTLRSRTGKTKMGPLFKSALVAALAIVIAVGAPVRATTIVATGDPATDWQNIQDALDGGGEVVLQNGSGGEIFDLTGEPSLMITCDVVLMGQDDAGGNMARIIANNGVEVAVRVYNPGGTVELDNLDIESALGRIIHVGWAIWWPSDDACKDLKVKNCRIVSTLPEAEAACIGTFGGVRGTVYLEGDYIAVTGAPATAAGGKPFSIKYLRPDRTLGIAGFARPAEKNARKARISRKIRDFCRVYM